MGMLNLSDKNGTRTAYMTNPKACLHCGKFIPYEKRNNLYCGCSCKASALNKNRINPDIVRDRFGKAKNGICIVCGKPAYDKYCSNKCQGEHKQRISAKKIENSDSSVCLQTVKKYLIEKRGHKCEICSNTTWLGKPIPLVLDHINGISEDDNLSNLRLICHNCHAQTETYAGKNKGKGLAKGREHRMERYYNEKRKRIYC